MIEYLQEENRILRGQLGGRKLRFTDDQRRRLAVKGRCLARRVFEGLDPIVAPNTLLRWYRELIAKRYYGAARRRAAVGRPPCAAGVRQLVVRFATDNSSWGYTRIQGALRNVGHVIGRNMIKRTLREHGLEPAPSRSKRMPWSAFLRAHFGVIGARDFFTAEVLTLVGLVRRYALFIIDIATRKAGETCEKLRPRGQELTAFAGRLALSIESDCLGKIIPLPERHLGRAVGEYVEHFYCEGNHQGRHDRLIIEPAIAANTDAAVARRERLGGILTFYHRSAA